MLSMCLSRQVRRRVTSKYLLTLWTSFFTFYLKLFCCVHSDLATAHAKVQEDIASAHAKVSEDLASAAGKLHADVKDAHAKVRGVADDLHERNVRAHMAL